jgi:hypothetical protein
MSDSHSGLSLAVADFTDDAVDARLCLWMLKTART